MSASTEAHALVWPTAPIALVSDGWSWQALAALDWIFVAAMVTLLLALAVGRWRLFAPLFAVGYGVQFWALMHTDVLTGQPLVAAFTLRILRESVFWRYDSLSWFFAMLTIGAAFVCSLFALALASPAGETREQGIKRQASSSSQSERRVMATLGAHIRAGLGAGSGRWHLFQVALAFAVLSCLGLFGSGNLLALYLSWELVVWAFFLLLTVGGGLALGATVRYATVSFAGGLALLGAVALAFHAAGSFDFARVSTVLPSLGLGQKWLLGFLLLVALGLRLGALTGVAWQPGSEPKPGPKPERVPVPVFWHGIAARVGFFAWLVLFTRMLGGTWLARDGWFDPRLLLSWAALWLVLWGGWRAWRQTNVGALLSWLALSQTGFVLLALVLGGALGTASGLMQLFSLSLAEAVLVGLCVVAVPLLSPAQAAESLHADLGLRRLALGAALFAGASLVGLPPSLGFVSKWLLYDAILSDPLLGFSRWPLFALALIGSLFCLLALLRLAAILRGQTEFNFAGRSEVIMAPVLGLSALTLLAGVLPGPALGWVAVIQSTLGVPVLDWTLGGVLGRFNMPWLTLWQMLLVLPLLAWLWWRWRDQLVQPERLGARLWRSLEALPLGLVENMSDGASAARAEGEAATDASRVQRFEPHYAARLLDGLAGLVAALSAPRLAPWSLLAALVMVIVWALD